MVFTRLASCAVLLALGLATPSSPLRAAEPDLPNPLIHERADPWVLRHSDGYTYFTATVPEYDRIELRRAPTLAGLPTAEPKTVWRKHATGPMGAHIWAPELHHIDGKWYLYFAAGEAEKIWAIRIYVLENSAANPLEGEWIERGQLRTRWESFALDATTFTHHGTRYLVWAQRDPAVANNTDLYIAKMDSPTSLTGPQILLSRPELDWEKVRYAVNEGPAVLVRHGRVFVTYSAAGTGAEYCLGLLSADENADLLDPKSWAKSPTPVFATSEAHGIFGPGHNCFTSAADGRTDLLVYHARNYRDIVGDPLRDPNRHTRVQPVAWRADGTPDFGTPIPEPSAASSSTSTSIVNSPSAVAHASLPAIPSPPAPAFAGTEAGATPSASSPSVVPLTLTLIPPAPAQTTGFTLGTARNPTGSTITADNRSLLLDGQPWTPVMGEFHYARTPSAEWREELLKMKAGGIDIVATYVFWIHHEEIAGQWDWSGARDLRLFVETARAAGLKVIVRCGPWCHGEVRNGGLPDWLVARGNFRSDDPTYLASAAALYAQIAAQLRGLLWKDGGPVIGIQLENEYGGPAEHLLTLKRLARASGLDTPLYTRTGWPALKTPLPFGEILPLYGVYAEGFWDRELTAMPGNYWAGFHFSPLRTDANIANEALGRRETRDAPDIARYPYLTCEIGGGMMSAYHRRILADPRDIEATTLVKLGSGSTSPGYYMYHGGTNPEGRQTTLMEEQSTAITNWNDMPVKNYDFQAPLGQYGQVRPHYHQLRRLHSFLHAFGPALAGTAVALPDSRPTGREDVSTLRWSVRSDGARGFLFVNNHERGRTLPPKAGVQFTLAPLGLTFPSAPITVPTDAAFLWPFNLDLGFGVTLAYATAQPLTYLDASDTRTVFFAATPGVPAEFAFAEQGITGVNPDSRFTRHDGRIVFRNVQPGRGVASQIQTVTGQELQIVLLNEPDSLALWQGPWRGRERVFLSSNPLVFDGGRVRATAALPRSETRKSFGTVTAAEGPDVSRSAAAPPEPILVFPYEALDVSGQHLPQLFAPVPIVTPTPQIATVPSELLKPAGPPRTITLGTAPKPVAAAPVDADFANAAVWRLKLPANLDLAANPLLRLHYVGDVARVHIGDTFVMDDYSNGEPLEIGLARYSELLKTGELTVTVLPLHDSPLIFRPVSGIPPSGPAGEATLTHAEIITRPTVEF